MATAEKVKVNTTVANKNDVSVVGTLKRVKGGFGYVLPHGAEAPVKVPVGDLISVKKGRAAKASAPAETGDTSAMPTHTTSTRPMTSKIQIIIRGTIRGPNWRSIARSFESVEDAKKYLGEFELVEVKGKTAKIQAPAEADVHANFEIDTIMKGIAPKYPLPVIIYASEEERKLTIPQRPAATATPAGDEAEGRGVTVKRTKKSGGGAKSNSNLVPLKQICREINLDPREARIKLRAAVKNKKIPHEPKGRWEWAKDEVDDMKAFLQGGGEKAKKAADVVAKKNEAEVKAVAKVKPSKKAAAAKKPEPKKVVAKKPAKKGGKR